MLSLGMKKAIQKLDLYYSKIIRAKDLSPNCQLKTSNLLLVSYQTLQYLFASPLSYIQNLVSQKGYLLYDRLVRPAMVGISKKPEDKSVEQKNEEN